MRALALEYIFNTYCCLALAWLRGGVAWGWGVGGEVSGLTVDLLPLSQTSSAIALRLLRTWSSFARGTLRVLLSTLRRRSWQIP